MAVPRNRHSNARKNKRRSHHARTGIQMVECKNCGNAHKPHHVCPSCGTYGGRSMIKSDSEKA